MKNLIQEWIKNDDKLFNLIVDIQNEAELPSRQAELAFFKLCDLYDIPRMPYDLEKNKNSFSRSLFEEYGLIKFLAPNEEDPRGLILSAAYNIINNTTIDYIEIANKEYNGNLPDLCQIGVSGKYFESNVVFFEKEANDWGDLGCKTLTTINKRL